MAAAAAPDAAVRAARLSIDWLPAFRCVAGYVAQGSEIDPLPLMRRLAEIGAALALPVAEVRDGPLAFQAWVPGQSLVPDAFGVPAPSGAPAATPDLVIVPLLAFDRSGGRLGQGAGHYDRTLAALRAAGPVFALGLAYAAQGLDRLPCEPHDQPLDAILTETQFFPVAREER